MASQCRQNYHSASETGINKQINIELTSSYLYHSISCYFDRDDVALKNFYEFFEGRCHDKRENAEKLMKFQNKRGGRIALKDVQSPSKSEWGSGLDAMQTAINLSKQDNQALLDLHKLADSNGDAQMCDWIESEFLTAQVEDIKKLSDHITNLKRVGPNLGEYLFDKHTLDS